MTDTSPAPEPARPRHPKEYDDPHYHDEDDDVQRDDRHRRYGTLGDRSKPAHRPPPRRRHFEE